MYGLIYISVQPIENDVLIKYVRTTCILANNALAIGEE